MSRSTAGRGTSSGHGRLTRTSSSTPLAANVWTQRASSRWRAAVGAGGARRALERCRRDREREHESNTRTRVGLGHQFLLQLSQLFPRLGSSFIHGSSPPRTPTPTDSTMQGDSRWACAVRGHGGECELGSHGADWAQLQSPGFYAITTVKRDYNV